MPRLPIIGRPGLPSNGPTRLLPTPGLRAPAWAAGLLWLAAGLSAGYWAMLAVGRSPLTPLGVTAPVFNAVDTADVARVLGAAPEAMQPTTGALVTGTQYRLMGVVAANAPDGAALIAVNGQPPRPYRVGATLEGGLVLQAVTRRGARLGASSDAPVSIELILPSDPAAPS